MPTDTLAASKSTTEPSLPLPPTVQINKMSDRFKEALSRTDTPVPPPTPTLEPKAPQKPAETQPDPFKSNTPKPEKPAESKEPKPSREHFKVLETQRDELKAKYEAAEARARQVEIEIQEVKAKAPKDYEEIKALAVKNQEFVDRFYVEQSPQFKAAFDEKIASSIDEAKETVGLEHAERVAELLAMPQSAKRQEELNEISSNLSSFQQAVLVKVFSDVRRMQKERSAELAKSAENVKNLKFAESEHATRTKLERQQALERAYLVTAAEAAQQSVHFKRVDGNEEHNQRVVENEQMLKEYTTRDLAPDEHAKLAHWAVRGIRSAQTDQIRDALISKLQAELKAIHSANPSVQGGGATPSTESKVPLTASEKYRYAMAHGLPTKD